MIIIRVRKGDGAREMKQGGDETYRSSCCRWRLLSSSAEDEEVMTVMWVEPVVCVVWNVNEMERMK
jgi:hypothetical protein